MVEFLKFFNSQASRLLQAKRTEIAIRMIYKRLAYESYNGFVAKLNLFSEIARI